VRSLLRTVVAWLGRAGILFVVLSLLNLILSYFAPTLAGVAGVGAVVAGIWLAVRLLRLAMRQAVWRLRNRLIVTYIFIAVVPIVLVATLAALAAWAILGQITVYLVTSELDRRSGELQSAAQSIAQENEIYRPIVAEQMRRSNLSRYPGIEVVLRLPKEGVHREPKDGIEPPPDPSWRPATGVLVRGNRTFLWAYAKAFNDDGKETGDVTVSAPLSSDWVAGLVPNLGPVTLVKDFGPGGVVREFSGTGRSNRIGGTVAVPPPVSRFDKELNWFARIPTLDWDHPNQPGERAILQVHSRASAAYNAVFNHGADEAQTVVTILIVVCFLVFVIVEVGAWVIGITMTRTITGAVHRLYEGTLRIREGDFSHRIDTTGNDQLGDLGVSFNQMTGNLERLLVVAKEKERLQSEIEIARDVQSQLFPRTVPSLPTLRMNAVCHPARVVSGDYYGFDALGGSQIALAVADVAGKGISAALLMAAIQSSLRTQLEDYMEAAAVAAGDGPPVRSVSTSRLTARLNRQLHATTSPEKYATFCLGVYDETSSSFTYTNAGHLPPLLVRGGSVDRLDVNGTVVGAFSFAKYTESRVELRAGDLLVFFSDGITEPENEYGEMFGEERLMELLAKNSERPESQIIDLVLESVRQFAKAGEAQDDMTILIARRV
jgi:sigma-B regulation protein RsbU (phosphoserine phosphatase)